MVTLVTERRKDNEIDVDADGSVVLLAEQLKRGLAAKCDREDPRTDHAGWLLHYSGAITAAPKA